MEDPEPADLKVVRVLAVIGMLVVGLHALVFGLLLAPPLVLYFLPLLFVCSRLLVQRRWAAVAAAVMSASVVTISAAPLTAVKPSSDWYTSLGPLYLVGGACYCLPLILVLSCSWRRLKPGL
jgi:hypothetical protein